MHRAYAPNYNKFYQINDTYRQWVHAECSKVVTNNAIVDSQPASVIARKHRSKFNCQHVKEPALMHVILAHCSSMCCCVSLPLVDWNPWSSVRTRGKAMKCAAASNHRGIEAFRDKRDTRYIESFPSWGKCLYTFIEKFNNIYCEREAMRSDAMRWGWWCCWQKQQSLLLRHFPPAALLVPVLPQFLRRKSFRPCITRGACTIYCNISTFWVMAIHLAKGASENASACGWKGAKSVAVRCFSYTWLHSRFPSRCFLLMDFLNASKI